MIAAVMRFLIVLGALASIPVTSVGAQQSALPQGMTVRELFSVMQERERANGQRFDAQERAVSAALAAAKEAVAKAEMAAEKRFDSVNEFRNTLKDQQQTLLPRAEAAVQFKTTQDRLESIEGRLRLLQGRSEGANWLWSIVLGLAGLVLGGATAVGVVKAKSKAA
jgi:hypothetical protein